MPKAELGEKQICPHCGAKFYDLGRRPAVCAKCHTAFDPEDETLKPRRAKARTPAFKPDPEEAEEETDAEAEADGAAEDEEEVEDAPELDAVVDDPVETGDEEEEEGAGALSPDSLPPGFSEDDPDLVDEDIAGADDDDVLFEDDGDFEDDTIEDVADGKKDDEA